MAKRSLLFLMAAATLYISSCQQCEQKETVLDGEVAGDTTESDTAERELDLFKKRAIPSSADANFDDFLYAFVTDDDFAEARLADSIMVETPDSTTKIPKTDWNDMHLFKYQELYTYIYTNERDEALIKSPDLSSVAFEWLNLDSLKSDRYEFHLADGKWYLDHIVRQHTIDQFQNRFLSFYCQFIDDKDFQEQSLANPVRLIDEGDSEMNEGSSYELKAGDWDEFLSQTPLPEKTIVMMDYGQKITPGTSISFLVRSITEPVSAKYHFRRTGGNWMLYSITLM